MSNEALAKGKYWINRDPLDELKNLRASIGWSGGVGYHIPLSDAAMVRLDECIAFNEGRELSPEYYKSVKQRSNQ